MKSWGYTLTAFIISALITACGSGTSSNWPTSTQAIPYTFAAPQSVALIATIPMAWGNNGYGQLGNSNSGNSLTPVPVANLFLPTVSGIVTNGTHSLAFMNGSTVRAWGNNGYGQLGNGTTTATYRPVKVFKNSTSLSNIMAVSAGGNHSLALDLTGKVWAWGWNNWGQVGYDTTTLGYSMFAKSVLTLAQGGAITPQIAAGGGHSLALDSNGDVWAWGYNYEGQLGNGVAVNSVTTANIVPVKVSGSGGIGTLTGVTALAAGGSHNLALLPDGNGTGRVVAWGYNKYGQLGNNTDVSTSVPVPVLDINNNPLTGVIAISAGLDHSLALKSDGSVWAWGNNDYGQLGVVLTKNIDGTSLSKLAVPVSIMNNGVTVVITRIQAIGHHSMAFSPGSGWGWGDNAYGQVGVNSTSWVTVPTKFYGVP